ncbi:hypothetical protein HNO89_001961 [Sporosarcina luteola]|nr:hypothetical protein [Sporosarcina luteola]
MNRTYESVKGTRRLLYLSAVKQASFEVLNIGVKFSTVMGESH